MPVLKNTRHEAFAQALAKGMTADAAYEAAGYRPSRKNASRLKSNEDIGARVAEIVGRGAQRAEVSVERVLQELGRIGFSDLRGLFTPDGGLLAVQDWPDDVAAAVASVEVVTKVLPGEADDELDAQPHGGALARKRNARVEYVHKIKLWDKNSALDKIAKHLGMFVEKVEHSGAMQVTISPSDAEL